MARFCICGCKRELRTEEGFTDYDRMFFDRACRQKDRAQRLRDQRARTKTQNRCSKCGQLIPKKNATEVNDYV